MTAHDRWLTRTPKEWDLEEDDLTDEELAELAGDARCHELQDDKERE